MYGYDVLIDNNLKPWLIEVNASPSLSTTTESDRIIKMNLMQDVFKIVIPPEWTEENSKHGTNLCKENKVGNFEVIINEAAAEEKKNAKNSNSNAPGLKNKAGQAMLWRWNTM